MDTIESLIILDGTILELCVPSAFTPLFYEFPIIVLISCSQLFKSQRNQSSNLWRGVRDEASWMGIREGSSKKWPQWRKPWEDEKTSKYKKHDLKQLNDELTNQGIDPLIDKVVHVSIK